MITCKHYNCLYITTNLVLITSNVCIQYRERPGSRFESRSRPIPAVSTVPVPVPVLGNLKVFPGIHNREWTTRQKLFIE